MSGNLQLDDRGFITTCPSCGQRNRLPFSGREARCGRCKTPLSPPAEPIEVPSVEAFDALVRGAGQPVVVDFWAPWCGPCRMVSPALEQLARDLAGRVKLVKVNVDTSPRISQRFDAQAIPTLLVLRGGQVAARQTGAAPLAALRAWVDNALDGDAH
jgi:thioredoxin 2